MNLTHETRRPARSPYPRALIGVSSGLRQRAASSFVHALTRSYGTDSGVLYQDFPHDASRHVGQAKVATCIAVGELLVIQTQ